MLYELIPSEDPEKKFSGLKPVGYYDFAYFGQLEKDLEDLIIDSIHNGVLFENDRLMTIWREQPIQPEADIYALDKDGDLTIFELKRSHAYDDAVVQGLRYAQNAGEWIFDELQEKFQKFQKKYLGFTKENIKLDEAHKEAFGLKTALKTWEFNRRQHILVIGSAADKTLIQAVDYWKKRGISINFIPYRIYEIEKKFYLEFFSLPFDSHSNPHDVKGVLFDTAENPVPGATCYMLKKHRVAAFEGKKHVVNTLNIGDIVFFYSVIEKGVVAVGKVISNYKEDHECYRDYSDIDAGYCDVEFIVPHKKHDDGRLCALLLDDIRRITGKNFFMARTIKVPYLYGKDIDKLIEALKDLLKKCHF